MATTISNAKWTLSAISDLYDMPLLDLVFKAAEVHRRHHDAREVQLCTLLSIKTGGCPEDCAYCPQSSRYDTGVDVGRMLKADEVLAAAHEAREAGSTRFCMGAAWREVTDGRAFDRVLEIVRGVRALGMEACCTLGMLTEDQARRLAEAGLSAYNHNLDTSEEYYGAIITTRTYEDRLQTIANVAKAGISVCCGGILGMGESKLDRDQAAAYARQSRPAAGERADQRSRPGRRYAAGRQAGARYASSWIRAIAVARIADAAGDGAAQRRAAVDPARGAGARLPRRRQFHLHRREAADDPQPRGRLRSRPARRPRPTRARAGQARVPQGSSCNGWLRKSSG